MCAGLFDKYYTARTNFRYLPPVFLRYRVHGAADVSSFLHVGKTIANNIESALTIAGKNLDSSLRVLDFGCGCGRTIIWFSERKCILHGTDIDKDAISWCRSNLRFAKFSVNNVRPPLTYGANSFDVVYAISVFTHLDLSSRNAWLEELNRILDDSGILVVSVHGEGSWKGLHPDDIEELNENGFIYRLGESGPFPSVCFQTSYETKEFAIKCFEQFFSVLDYVERGINNHQDLLVLKKKTFNNNTVSN